MAQVKKANVPPTHPTVYVGLGLAVAGLLLAMYAYTGTRVYDFVFAFVALFGALLAMGGILTAAFGRAFLQQRAARARRGLNARNVPVAQKEGEKAPPTVAAPPEKKQFTFPRLRRPEKPSNEDTNGSLGSSTGRRSLFAFRRPPQPESAPSVSGALVVERLTLACPQCAREFTAEGSRPLQVTCPGCGLSDTV